MREYTVVYEEGPTSWGAWVPDLPGCYAVGKSYDEAQDLIRGAIEMYIEDLVLSGEPVPAPVHRSGQVAVAA